MNFHPANSTDDSGAITAGQPPYIIQEEFDRFSGYTWADQRVQTEDSSQATHWILFEEADARHVPVIHIPDYSDLSVTEQHRYPYAGALNANVELRLVQFSTTEACRVGCC